MSETKKSDFPSDLGAWYMKAWKDAVNKEHCDNCAKKSDKKTLVQIRDELASSYGYGPMSQNDFEKLKYFKPDNSKVAQEMSKMSFQAGFDAALALSEKRAAGLVEVLNKITIQATSKEYLEEYNDELDGITAIEAWDSLIIEAREALSKFRSEI